MILFKMLTRGIISEINGCISTGKEVGSTTTLTTLSYGPEHQWNEHSAGLCCHKHAIKHVLTVYGGARWKGLHEPVSISRAPVHIEAGKEEWVEGGMEAPICMDCQRGKQKWGGTWRGQSGLK